MGKGGRCTSPDRKVSEHLLLASGGDENWCGNAGMEAMFIPPDMTFCGRESIVVMLLTTRGYQRKYKENGAVRTGRKTAMRNLSRGPTVHTLVEVLLYTH